MEEQPGFVVQVSQNKYLSADDREVHAILTVTAHGVEARARPEAAEVIAIDCSGSMSGSKIIAARRAARAAVDALRDGVYFAVVEGTSTARVVYPETDGLVPATAQTRRAAKRRIRGLVAGGGTLMGAWLREARRLLDAHPDAVRHAILLTDGWNNDPRDLDRALEHCAGRFVCDARGIGDDYAPDEVLRIANTLRGTADAIVEDADLEAEFEKLMRNAMSKVVAEVWLRLRTMPFTRLRSLRQVYPTEIDLTPAETPIDERMRGFSTGSWAAGEEREFHVCLEVDPSRLARNEDVQAARVDVAVVGAGTTEMSPSGKPVPILAHWTEDIGLSSVIDSKVAHYRGYTDLATAVEAGQAAYEAGDTDRAAEEWGRAVRLAAGFRDEEMLRRLGRLVDVIGDPADGKVRVKQKLRPRDVFSALIGSHTTTRGPAARPRHDRRAAAAGPEIPCPSCAEPMAATDRVCEACGTPLDKR